MTWSGYTEGGGGSEQRGPSTFSFQVPQPPQAAGADPVLMRSERHAGGVDILQTPSSSSLLTGLLGIAAGAAGPALQKAKDEAFLRGMQRAASGEALESIVKDQPWYAKIFGESGVVDGARAYTVAAQAAKFTANLDRDGPDLQEIPPEDMPALLMERIKGYTSGDEQADMMLHMEVLKNIPTIIKAQTKRHYQYLQEKASAARFSNMQQQSSAYEQAARRPDYYDEDDIAGRKVNLLQSFIPQPGANEASWRKDMFMLAQGEVQQGNFHTINAMKEAGLIQQFSPEQQLQFMNAERVSKARAAAAAKGDYTSEVQTILTDVTRGVISAEDVNTAFDALNEDYKQKSGNDVDPFGPSTKTSTGMQAIHAVLARDKELTRELARQEEGEELQEHIQVALGAGQNTARLVSALRGKVPNHAQVVEDAAYEQFSILPPEQKIQWLTNDAVGGRAIPGIQQDITQLENTFVETPNDNWDQYAALVGALDAERNNNPAIALYFDHKEVTKAREYNRIMEAHGNQPEYRALAFEEARQKGSLMDGSGLTDKEEKAARSFINKEVRGSVLFSGWGELSSSGQEKGWLPGSRPPDLTPAAKRTVLSAIGPVAHDLLASGAYDQNSAFSESLARAQAGGLEIVGSYAFVSPQGTPTFYSSVMHTDPEMGISPPEFASGLNAVIEGKLKELDVKHNDVLVARAADQNGQPTLTVFPLQHGIGVGAFQINGEDILKHVQESRHSKTATGQAEQLDEYIRTRQERMRSTTRGHGVP